MWGKKKQKRIYLDYAAATPVRREVIEAMQPYFNEIYGNPSAIHSEGVATRKAVEEARGEVARTLRVRPDDITFTASGTESNNLALLGHIEYLRTAGMEYADIEIISMRTEHPSVKNVLQVLERKGCHIIYVSIDEEGRIAFAEFQKLLSPKTRLVTFAYANSETGVVQDINRFGRAIRAYEKENDVSVLFHTDASQAPLWLSCALDALSVDMMTLDAGKCYGPKGVGLLAHRPKAKLATVLQGGSQESGLRPGTENVAGIVGCAKALTIAQEGMEARVKTAVSLRNSLMETFETIEGVTLNGAKDTRLANNINISIPDIDTEYAVVVLDAAGIACSTKSACNGADGRGSYVIEEMTHDLTRAAATIRFSLGEETTQEDIDTVVTILAKHVEITRQFNKTLTPPPHASSIIR